MPKPLTIEQFAALPMDIQMDIMSSVGAENLNKIEVIDPEHDAPAEVVASAVTSFGPQGAYIIISYLLTALVRDIDDKEEAEARMRQLMGEAVAAFIEIQSKENDDE